MLEAQLTEVILAAFFTVYKALGFGFLESVYVNALCVELQRRGVKARRQVPVEVTYEGVVVGTYRCDILVEERVLLEVKAAKALSQADERQMLNYLRATRIELGLLLHFGPQPRFRRWILTNDRKASTKRDA